MGTGGFLRLDHAFANAEASFLMTFAMGGVPHAHLDPGKWHPNRSHLREEFLTLIPGLWE